MKFGGLERVAERCGEVFNESGFGFCGGSEGDIPFRHDFGVPRL